MKALVTGGGGFLGRRIVELLLERGDEVHFCARGSYPEVEALGATGHQVDICDAEAISEVVKGTDVVFHVAAKAGMWGPLEGFRAINADGTRNVIEACKAHGVKKLVYTSTPSVVGYEADIENGPQDIPYPDAWGSPYAQTKAEGEKLVLAANSPELLTVSLRPHLIFGPRDQHLMTRVVAQASAGKLPIVGDGENKMDLTFVDNAAWAHLDAEQALTGPDAPCAGKAYFISNDEPVKIWHWVNDDLLGGLGIPKITRQLSLGTARFVGGVMEFLWNTLPLSGEPRMTRFIATVLAKHHWYDMEPAKRDLGYSVRVPMDEGTQATVAWFKEQVDAQKAAA